MVMNMENYDIVIAGGSFAGLSVARFSKGKKLILERGASFKQRSTCGVPLFLTEKLGCKGSVLRKFDKIFFRVDSSEFEVKLKYQYCTIDYYKFCSIMASKAKNTEISYSEPALSVDGNTIVTSKRDVESEVIVDCTGWNAALASSIDKGYGLQKWVSAIDTETEYDEDALHFYYYTKEKKAAWIFPVDKGLSRMGIITEGSNLYSFLLNAQKKFLSDAQFCKRVVGTLKKTRLLGLSQDIYVMDKHQNLLQWSDRLSSRV